MITAGELGISIAPATPCTAGKANQRLDRRRDRAQQRRHAKSGHAERQQRVAMTRARCHPRPGEGHDRRGQLGDLQLPRRQPIAPSSARLRLRPLMLVARASAALRENRRAARLHGLGDVAQDGVGLVGVVEVEERPDRDAGGSAEQDAERSTEDSDEQSDEATRGGADESLVRHLSFASRWPSSSRTTTAASLSPICPCVSSCLRLVSAS